MITPSINPKFLDVPTKHMQELAPRCMFFEVDVVMLEAYGFRLIRRHNMWNVILTKGKTFLALWWKMRILSYHKLHGWIVSVVQEMEKYNHIVFCDTKIPLKLKEFFCRTTVWPKMLYGTECWVVESQCEKRICVANMRVLYWMCDITLDKIYDYKWLH